jgi:hypothetical protein
LPTNNNYRGKMVQVLVKKRIDAIPATAISSDNATTLEEAERQYILHTLKDTRWVIGGSAGALAQLGYDSSLPGKKLGIVRPK